MNANLDAVSLLLLLINTSIARRANNTQHTIHKRDNDGDDNDDDGDVDNGLGSQYGTSTISNSPLTH